jgi:hypothetical protein
VFSLKRECAPLKNVDVAAFALNTALYVATGIIFYTILPLSFGQVRFWPQAIIPAVFSVVFGPWVGGLGAALGIFVNDLVLNSNPLLSLMAGVTSNFAAFWLIGYIANKQTRWKFSVVAFGVISALLIGLALVYTELLFATIIAGSFALLVVVALLTPKWRSYEVGSVIGLLVGSAIIGITVPLYGQYFTTAGTPITVPLALATFIWTFSSEIPFLLALGPPIIEAIHRAFPNFKKEKPREQQ